MESNTHLFPWLEMIDRPAFCVKEGIVLSANSAAEHRMLQAGMDVWEIVTQNRSAYESFHSGSLYLTVTAGSLSYNACVTRTKDCDIFIIQQTEEDAQLQALALAAQQLRIPLSNMMTATDSLFAKLDQTDAQTQQQASQMNRSLFQILRIITNMSDANQYKNATLDRKQTVNFTALFDEIIEKIQATTESSRKKLSYTGLNVAVMGLANDEKIGRAIYNLLSNALKFSPEGTTVDAKLTKNGNTLTFTVCNTNLEPIEDSTFWNRYRREPSIQDERFGLGLGMSLISSVACSHGGTVLVDHPTASETRVTMTIAVVNNNSDLVRSPMFRIGDYAGGRDIGLLELAEVLPADAYLKTN